MPVSTGLTGQDLETVRDHLRRAFEIDSNWPVAALDDKDLEPLWNPLSRGQPS